MNKYIDPSISNEIDEVKRIYNTDDVNCCYSVKLERYIISVFVEKAISCEDTSVIIDIDPFEIRRDIKLKQLGINGYKKQ